MADDLATKPPLRQTCNRCRNLKVRCQSFRSQPEPSAEPDPMDRVTTPVSCVRCSRAGTLCTFESKQRSGRPRTHKVRLGSFSSSAPSTRSPQTPPISIHGHPYLDETALDEVMTFSNDQALLLSSLEASSVPDMSMLPTLEEFDAMAMVPTPPESAVFPNLDHSPSAALPEDLRQPSTYESDASIPQCMKALMDLDLRICRLQARATSAPPTPSFCDDVTDAARSLLMVMERAGEITQEMTTSQVQTPETGEPLQRPGHKRLEADLRRQTISLAMYPDDSYSRSLFGGVDMSVFWHILACYQRLIDLFKEVCLSIHAQVEESSEHGQSTSSMAQSIMTTELISHLIGRLSRGLNQLTARMVPPSERSQPLHDTLAGTSILAPHFRLFSPSTDPLSGLWSATERRSNSVAFSDILSSDGSQPSDPWHNVSCFQGVVSVIEILSKRKEALCAHIANLKHLIQESDHI